MSPRAVPRRVRFAALVLVADTSDDPDDSSNERFGERRYSRSRAYKPGGNDGNAGGEADRELGRGISAGVGVGASTTTGTTVDEDADCRCVLDVRRGRESGFGAETVTGASLLAEAEPARARALLGGLEDGLEADGRSCGTESAGSSHTFGRPEWGPRRLRIDEKCSQSWYLPTQNVSDMTTARDDEKRSRHVDRWSLRILVIVIVIVNRGLIGARLLFLCSFAFTPCCSPGPIIHDGLPLY